MALSEKRAGEIALKMLEHRAVKTGLPDPQSFKRELGNISKEIGVPIEELVELSQMMVSTIISKMFGAAHVSITLEHP